MIAPNKVALFIDGANLHATTNQSCESWHGPMGASLLTVPAASFTDFTKGAFWRGPKATAQPGINPGQRTVVTGIGAGRLGVAFLEMRMGAADSAGRSESLWHSDFRARRSF